VCYCCSWQLLKERMSKGLYQAWQETRMCFQVYILAIEVFVKRGKSEKLV